MEVTKDLSTYVLFSMFATDRFIEGKVSVEESLSKSCCHWCILTVFLLPQIKSQLSGRNPLPIILLLLSLTSKKKELFGDFVVQSSVTCSQAAKVIFYQVVSVTCNLDLFPLLLMLKPDNK